MKNILITGGTGFIAQALFPVLSAERWNVRTTLRSKKSLAQLPKGVQGFVTGNLENVSDWKPLLDGVDVVVHLAARVHVLKETTRDPLAEFRQVNVAGTERLARMAAEAGVQRLVYISSIGVNGKKTNKSSQRCYSEVNPPLPYDPYTISKWEAEQVLLQVSQETGLEIVILRPPLVYGPNAPGNFDRLINLVYRGFPLPLASVKNSRSFIYVGNLVSAIIVCVDHPAAANQTFLVSDREDVSTPELIRRIAYALGRPARLFPFPPSLLYLAGRITGQLETVDRLLNSLVIDSSKICRELNWTPPYSMEQGLEETAEWFKRQEL